MAGSNSSGILDSLRLYDAARLNAMEVTRHEGSNIDHVVTSEGEEFPLCHLSGLVPFTYGDFVPQMVGFEAAATIALAAQHLNTGDGSIVPEVAGLDKRCKVRFTVEFADTQFSEGAALNHVITQTKREVGSLSEQNPCAFIGAYRSAVSIPTSIVTGLLGYPQISAASTSAELDDKSLFPLFGRTLPSDAGNSVPIVKFMHDILNINHLAVVNVNDSFGNNFIEGLRNAAAIHAPGMKIIQTPLDEEQGSIKDAVASLKATGFRFIFCLVFTPTTHDALLTEGFEQGIAGTGHHNWIFADSFSGTLGDRTFKKGSPLHLAYRGSSVIEVSGGVPGIPRFDSFEAKLSELRNPADLAYLGPRFPVYDDPRYGTDIPFVGSDSFLSTVKDSYAPFHYEAAISLGLAACSAYEDNASFSGQEHFERLKELDFTGISGNVVFDPITGTREPSSAIYKVTNQVVQDVDQDNIAFKPVVTNIFQGDAWDEVVPYLFNDGTATLPNDTDPSPPESSGPSLGIVIGASVASVVILGLVLWICYERRRKRNSTVWEVKEEDLIFSDPPEVIGQGTFGVVHLAEYRGTAVAVKRVIPPSSSFTKKGSVMDSEEPSDASSSSGLNSLSKLGKARGADSGSSSWNKVSGEPLASWGNMSLGHLRSMGRSAPNSLGMFGKKAPNVAAQWKKMKQDFIEEMQYLSKLRHPCITTIMGK
jgi:Receptor family ligand binding region